MTCNKIIMKKSWIKVLSAGLSSQPKKRAFTTLILICICLVVIPIYTVWDRKSLRPNLDLSSWTTKAPNNRTVVNDRPDRPSTINFDIIQSVRNSSNANATSKSPSVHQDNLLPPSTSTAVAPDRRTDRINRTDQQERYPPPTRLVNIPDFEYLMNPDICHSDDQVFMLVMVGSHPKNSLVRDAIRQTWGNPNITGSPFKLVFTFGKLVNSPYHNALDEEIKNRGDIVQGNFEDSYHNVTARDLMAMRWAWTYCPQAKYVMRADDDISVDVFVLKDVLELKFGDYNARNKSLLACFAKFVGAPVLREGNYRVSKVDHPSDTYENYCSGWMYVVNVLAAKQLDSAALVVKPYWMNDAYITGTLSAVAKIAISDLKIGATFNYDDMVAMMDARARLPVRYSLGYVGGDVKLMRNLHQKYKREYFEKSKS